MENIIGKIYGKLTVLEITEVVNTNRTCIAKCECGKIKKFLICNLKKGNSKCCGCNRIAKITNNKYSQIYNYDENFFKNLNPFSLYVLGLLYTDGNLSKNRYTIFLNLQEKDKSLLEKISFLIKRSNKLTYLKPQKSPSSDNLCQAQYRVNINNKNIYNDLLKLGLYPNKSKTLVVNNNLIESVDFWRGVVDGDGCIHVNNKLFNLSLCGGSKILLEQFKNFCLKFINSKAKVNKKKNQNFYDFQLTGTNAKTIYKVLYEKSDLFIDRKKKYLEFL